VESQTGRQRRCEASPVAQWSGWVARMAGLGRGALRIPLALAGLSVAVASGTYIFIWYMTELIPIVNWQVMALAVRRLALRVPDRIWLEPAIFGTPGGGAGQLTGYRRAT
jgi:hypothetical protein